MNKTSTKSRCFHLLSPPLYPAYALYLGKAQTMKTHKIDGVAHHFKKAAHHMKRHTHHIKLSLAIAPLLVAGALLVYVAVQHFGAQKKVGPLNVILISIDSLRTDHMSLYGYTRKTTPNIDDWAKNAAVFKNYFSTSYLTPISEVSVHTGQYPFTSGVVNFESPLPNSIPTLGEILKQHGWQTASFGTSAEFSGYVAGINLSRGFDVYKYSHAGGDPFNGRGGNPAPQSIAWMKRAQQKDKPFFLWLTFGSAHWPYGQTEQHHFSDPKYTGYFQTASYDTWNLVSYLYKGDLYGRYVKNTPLRPVAKLNKSDFNYLVGRYDDGILMTDRRLGQLLRFVKDSGLDENTVVILESEHGEGFNERGYVMHYDIYDEQVHTPLIIRAPKLKPQQVDALASGVDVLPTLLSILNIPAPKNEGVNFLPYLQNGGEAPRDEVYITRTSLWERVMSSMRYEGLEGFYAIDSKEHFADTAIRDGDWKLIHRRSRLAMAQWSWFNILTGNHTLAPEYELYYLKDDPGEKKNVYDVENGNPTIVDLQDKLTAWEEKEFKTPLPHTTGPEIQPYF